MFRILHNWLSAIKYCIRIFFSDYVHRDYHQYPHRSWVYVRRDQVHLPGLHKVAVPALRSKGRPLMACNRAYARPERVIDGHEEIAAFPAVSGG